jgi:hypothetical protein
MSRVYTMLALLPEELITIIIAYLDHHTTFAILLTSKYMQLRAGCPVAPLQGTKCLRQHVQRRQPRRVMAAQVRVRSSMWKRDVATTITLHTDGYLGRSGIVDGDVLWMRSTYEYADGSASLIILEVVSNINSQICLREVLQTMLYDDILDAISNSLDGNDKFMWKFVDKRRYDMYRVLKVRGYWQWLLDRDSVALMHFLLDDLDYLQHREFHNRAYYYIHGMNLFLTQGKLSPMLYYIDKGLVDRADLVGETLSKLQFAQHDTRCIPGFKLLHELGCNAATIILAYHGLVTDGEVAQAVVNYCVNEEAAREVMSVIQPTEAVLTVVNRLL